MRYSYLGDIPNVHVRDYQRKKVYDAEEQCLFWKDGIVELLSLSEMKQLVSDISHWASITPPEIQIQHTSIPTAYATADAVVLPFDKAHSKPFICHEMAHVINYQNGPADHHGPNFTGTYLSVVKNFIGRNASTELCKSFKLKRVKYVGA